VYDIDTMEILFEQTKLNDYVLPKYLCAVSSEDYVKLEKVNGVYHKDCSHLRCQLCSKGFMTIDEAYLIGNDGMLYCESCCENATARSCCVCFEKIQRGDGLVLEAYDSGKDIQLVSKARVGYDSRLRAHEACVRCEMCEEEEIETDFEKTLIFVADTSSSRYRIFCEDHESACDLVIKEIQASITPNDHATNSCEEGDDDGDENNRGDDESSGGQFYYVDVEGKQQGPVSGYEIVSLLQEGVVSAKTLVWTLGMSDWQTIEALF